MRTNRAITNTHTQRIHHAAGGGFSLIELVLVLTIIAILSAIAVPRYAGSLARYRADAAAQRVVADLNYARELAKSTSTSVEVVVINSTDKVRIVGAADLNDPAKVYKTCLAESPYQADIVSRDFNGDRVVIFNGYGDPDSGGTVVITVGTESRTVVLDPDSGKAVVQ